MSAYVATLIILQLVVAIFGFSFLLYLTQQFWKFRHHFLISSRFPKITLCISYSMYIATAASAIGHAFIYHNDKETAISSTLLYPISISLAQIFAFLFCAVIVFRALLMYDRWGIMRYALNNQTKIIFGHNELLQNQPQKHTYYCCYGQKITFFHPLLMWSVSITFIILFIITCICTPLVLIGKLSFVSLAIPFIIILIVGFVVLFYGRKINDFVLFKRETYLVILLIFAQIIVSQLAFIGAYLAEFVGFVLGSTGCYVILILSLSMVYKNEGSLLSDSADFKPANSLSSTSSISPSDSAADESAVNVGVGTKATDKITAMSLDNYLKSLDHYNRFGEFLCGCFALENLLFFVKIIVFRHTLLDIIKIDSEDQSVEFLDKWRPVVMKNAFALRFEYIDGLYDSLKANKNKSVHNIAKNIYDQFIANEAVFEVNISAENRDFLTDFFNQNTAHGIEEYLTAFNGAIVEVYRLLQSVDNFRYK